LANFAVGFHPMATPTEARLFIRRYKMLHHLYPSKWPSRFARLWLFLSELLFAWAVIKFVFAPFRGTTVPYWLAFDDSVSLYFILVVWGGISALFMIRLIWKYHIGWLLGSIFCAFCATAVLFGPDWWEHIDVARFNGQTFHLARSVDVKHDWASYLLCEDDGNGNVSHCRVVYAGYSSRPANLVIDPVAGKLSVVLRAKPYYQFDEDEVVYTLDSSGAQWCLNPYSCKTQSEK
jgi:hypothetical protein